MILSALNCCSSSERPEWARATVSAELKTAVQQQDCSDRLNLSLSLFLCVCIISSVCSSFSVSPSILRIRSLSVSQCVWCLSPPLSHSKSFSTWLFVFLLCCLSGYLSVLLTPPSVSRSPSVLFIEAGRPGRLVQSESGGDGRASVEKEDTGFLKQNSFTTLCSCETEYPVNTLTACRGRQVWKEYTGRLMRVAPRTHKGTILKVFHRNRIVINE